MKDPYVRQWEKIQFRLETLMSSAPTDRIAVVCEDGFRMQLGFASDMDPQTEYIGEFSVRVQSDSLRERWGYARNPARGKFFGVLAEDVIELIWEHCGIDLVRSREATQLMKARQTA